MKKALVVGGNSGIGLAIVCQMLLEGYEHVYIIGKEPPLVKDVVKEVYDRFNSSTTYIKTNLVNEKYEVLENINDIDTLIITAGFGRVAPFEELTKTEIANLIKCNCLSAIQIIKHYYNRIHSSEDFYCGVMGSIAGHVVSPLFSVYGASKFALCSFIENVNAELSCKGYKNRILDVSPGSLKGTNFNGGGNNIGLNLDLAKTILEKVYNRESLFIPEYEEVYKDVLNRYHDDPIKYAMESYDYKLRGNRIVHKPQVVIGYLSGTFDLFHVGHLNLLKRAKEHCDYLIVGVHKSGAWKGKETFIPFEERKEIVANIKYVDKVIESYHEDCDAYDVYHYDKLFVGSDYKGTERFNRYEEYFKDKGVEIIYFPYTKGTSSTQLREAIKSKG